MGVEQNLSMKHGMDKMLGKVTLQKPGERNGGDKIFGWIDGTEDLVRYGGPEYGEVPCLDGDLLTAE